MNDSEECFAFAEHLHLEHHRLNELLREIAHGVAQLGPPADKRPVFDPLVQRIAHLRQQLLAHYAEEEAGGCLEEAVTRCPSLAGDVKSVVAEHPQLDEMLKQLLAQAADPAVTPAALAQQWQAFYKRIQAHEATETRLLRMAFGSETAETDVEEAE